MSFDKLNKIVNQVAKMAEESEKIALPILSVKLEKLADEHPYDPTIVSIADVISKLADKNIFIKRAELKDLYNKFYTRNTRFAEFCKDELAIKEAKVTKQAEPQKDLSIGYDNDPVLTNALNALFDKNVEVKLYSEELGNKAKTAVASNLDGWGLKSTKLNVEAGNDKFIVVKADYETPKGLTSLLVPVEIQKNKVLEPSLFMSNAGPKDLNYQNIKNYLTTFAGKQLKISANDIVNTLTKVVSPVAEISDAELALTKLNASRESLGGIGQITGQSLFAEAKEIELPKLAEAETFAEKLGSPIGAANMKFGPDNVSKAREMVYRTVNAFGFGAPNVSVAKCEENAVFYAVSIPGKTAFTVPVKIAGSKVEPANFMICNGSVSQLSKSNVNELLIKNEVDYLPKAFASAQYGLKPSELVDNVSKAMDASNYEAAEDSLNVLMQGGHEEAYKQAFDIYVAGLSGKKATAAEQCKCTLIMKSANSIHPVCGHTGLPTHKVYQDEYGNCLPLYRKSEIQNKDSGFFMNYKIFG